MKISCGVSHRPRLCFADDAMCRHILGYAPPADAYCRPAETLEEHKEAFRIVHAEYLKRGFCPEDPSGLYYHPYAMLPSARTFILSCPERLLGTVTLIGDSSCGLPMEAAFPELIGRLRFEGRKLGEVSMLALNLDLFRSGCGVGLTDFHRFSAAFWLFGSMVDHCRRVSGISDLVITVHPSQEKIYRNFAFLGLGKPAPYPLAGGKPGLPMHLDLRQLEQTLPQERVFWQFFFGRGLGEFRSEKTFRWCHHGLSELISRRWYAWGRPLRGSIELLKRRHPEIRLPDTAVACN